MPWTPHTTRDSRIEKASGHSKAMEAAFFAYVTVLRDALEAMPAEYLTSNLDNLPYAEAEQVFIEEWTRAMEAEVMAGASLAASAPIFSASDAAILRSSFAIDNPYTQDWVRQHAAKLVQEVTGPTRDALRNIMVSEFGSHLTVQQTARLIRGYTDAAGIQHPGVVGLLSAEQAAVEAQFLRWTTGGMLPEQALRASERYARRLLMERGARIARNETNEAQSNGKRQAWNVAADQGLVVEGYTERVWITAPSERTCDICLPMHGKRAPVRGSYPNGMSGPPVHTLCRCTEGLYTHGLVGFTPPKEYTEEQLARMVGRSKAHERDRARRRRAWKRRGATNRGAKPGTKWKPPSGVR